jgi:hypothetical protein
MDKEKVRQFLDLSDETRLLFARLLRGQAGSSEVIGWAANLVKQGNTQPALKTLAELPQESERPAVESLFKQSLEELKWEIPPRSVCLRWNCYYVARQIVEGKLTPVEGCQRVYEVVFALNLPFDLKAWIYLDDGLHPRSFENLTDSALDKEIMLEARRLIRDEEKFLFS